MVIDQSYSPNVFKTRVKRNQFKLSGTPDVYESDISVEFNPFGNRGSGFQFSGSLVGVQSKQFNNRKFESSQNSSKALTLEDRMVVNYADHFKIEVSREWRKLLTQIRGEYEDLHFPPAKSSIIGYGLEYGRTPIDATA